MIDEELDEVPDVEKCPKCQRTVVIAAMSAPNISKSECSVAGCPINATHLDSAESKSTGKFILFADLEDEEES